MASPDTIAPSGSTIDTISVQAKLGLVVIGRNEGERLIRCLDSVQSIPNRVYVDSGSTDGSVGRARERATTVVELPVPPNFTAARARNAGLAALLARDPDLQFVQMVDGDCEICAGWLNAALPVLQAASDIAVVYGRLRERFPQRSVYNALCDDEWNMPIGEGTSCGGVALFRIAALRDVGFYNETMIAGEEPELSFRLRKRGWRLRCLEFDMALHDAAILHFSQWWQRARRSGHGFAEAAFLHPDARKPNWKRSVSSIIFWSAVVPSTFAICLILALLVDAKWELPAATIVLSWPARMIQMILREYRRGLSLKLAIASGILLVLGKAPQLLGLVGYHWNRLGGRTSQLIEHKRPQKL